MIFNSTTFLIFLFLTFFSYWSLPLFKGLSEQTRRVTQNVILLAASYIFYSWINHWFLFLILASTLIDYFCAQKIYLSDSRSRKKIFLIISIVANLGILCFFKYFNFFAENFYIILETLGFRSPEIFVDILLPVGISFYTFQSMSYSVDIYRKKIKPERNFIDFALYISFFPQLVAGPIERASRILPQLKVSRYFKLDNIKFAFPLILSGYVKKLVIADNLGLYVDKVFSFYNPDIYSLIVGSIAFSIQIYADFSAYSDIARGVARLFGIELMKNFNSPYLAKTPSDFWRRWHISFSTWIRDYLYIPLGGSKARNAANLLFIFMVTFGLSGLWHGAAWNYILWGFYNAIIIWIYHILGFGGKIVITSKIKSILAISSTYLMMVFGWSLFRTQDMFWYFKAITNSDVTHLDLFVPIYVLLFTIFYSLPLLVIKLSETTNKTAVKVACYLFLGLSLIYFSTEVQEDFIYFQF